MHPRVVAVDWSGAKEPLSGLWLAEAEPGQLLDVRPFVTRVGLVDHLIAEKEARHELVVGLDFAFSLPEWFLDAQGIGSVSELWERVTDVADEWLKPKAPFWDQTGKPEIEEEFRQTDKDLRPTWRPSSVFKLVGPDQVGRGSLRGMPFLGHLEQEHGFAVWPFRVGTSQIVEIYPAVLTGLKGRTHAIRLAEAVRDDDRVPGELKAHAACCQDAFDAAKSALAMAERVDELRSLEPAAPGSPYAREGRIWPSPAT